MEYYEKAIMKRKILLIEDDTELASLIATYLRAKGFEVDVENDGAPAVARIVEMQPDLVIVDLMLPNMDGISICKMARSHYQGLIMMLTASTDDFDQVVALEIGVDDFVQKPIEPRVLLARVNALFRRLPDIGESLASSLITANLQSFKSMVINFSARKVLLSGEPVPLNTPEYDLLCYLVERAGQVIPRDELFKALKKLRVRWSESLCRYYGLSNTKKVG